jgi:hypothetical protein
MKSVLNTKESLLRRFILVGFSHPKASFFLLRGQKKETKEKAARLPLESCAPRIYPGLPKGISYPFGNARHPCRAPVGLFRVNAAVLGAANGNCVLICG